MSELQQALRNLGMYHQTFSGRLSVDRRLSTVRMRYESDGVMELRGLPSGLPLYVRFDQRGVKLSPTGDYEKQEFAEALNIYRIFDPRTVSKYLLDQEEKQVETTTTWVTAFSPQKMNKDFPVIKTLAEWMQKQAWEGKSIWETEQVFFGVEHQRLVEMIVPELPPLGPHLSIEFSYGSPI